MPLTRYKNGIRAGKILEVSPVEIIGVGTCVKLVLDGSEITLNPQWYATNNPQVGAWFVTDTKIARCVAQFDGEKVNG